MRTISSLLVGLLVTTLSCGPAGAWSHSGRYGSASGGGGSWSASGDRGGSASGGGAPGAAAATAAAAPPAVRVLERLGRLRG